MKLTLVFLVLVSTLSLSGNISDSLRVEVTRAKEDTSKVNLLNKLAFEIIDDSYEEASDLANQAVILSKNLDFIQGESNAYYTLGRILAMNNKFEMAIEQVEKSISISDSKKQIMKGHLLLGWVYEKMAKLYESLSHYKLAEEISVGLIEDKTISDIYLNIGRIHNLLEDTDLALSYYDKAAKHYHDEKNLEGLVYYNLNIGYIHYRQLNYDTAIGKYKVALQGARDLKLKRVESNIMQNMVISYIDANKLAEAKKLIPKIRMIDACLKDEIGLANAQIALSKIHLKEGKKGINIDGLIKAYKIGEETKDLDLQQSSAELLAQVYIDKGDFREAISQINLSYSLKDSIDSKEIKVKIQNLERIKEVELHKKDMLLKENELRRSYEKQTLIKWMLIVPLLLLATLSFFLYRSYSLALSRKTELEEKNENLKAAESTLENQNKDLKKYIEQNIELEQFAHIASHDIKSPLRTISGFSGLLEKELSSDITVKQKEYFGLVQDGVKRLDDLVDDLLQYSIVNSQKLNINEIVFGVMFKNILDNLRIDIKEKQAQIFIKGEEVVFKADKTILLHIIQNLISNSLRFKHHSRDLVINVECYNRNDYTYISVDDNGIGIDPKYSNKIFEKFVQLNSKDQYGGTGLGLSICKKYITRHKGKIWHSTKSEPGFKLVFSIPQELS